MNIAALILLAILPALLIVAAISDLTTMTIPNWISGLLILAFFPAALVAGLPLSSVAVHLGVGLAVLIVGMGLFALRVMGGGDVKLMAATCLWLGLSSLGDFVVGTAIAGGLLSLALMAARTNLAAVAANAPGWVSQLLQPKGGIPYGVAIAAGALAAFPYSVMMSGLLG